MLAVLLVVLLAIRDEKRGASELGLAELASAGQVVFADSGKEQAPASLWGAVDCERISRVSRVPTDGDPHLPATGTGQQPDPGFRRLTVVDGDDLDGERCELGLNNHVNGPTTLYREGERRLTSFSLRLAENFPLATQDWQVVMQMKQTQPSANGGGTPVISLSALRGEWRLHRSTSVGPSSGSELLWSAPAETGRWTRFAFDVNYSQDASLGSIKVYVDLNGDGDSSDPGEQSPAIQTYTLKQEIPGGSTTDGIAPGVSIPSHLRLGIYHDPEIECPPPAGCAVDVDNIQVSVP